jgi:NitT/TauT family transport system substrate-binding protein
MNKCHPWIRRLAVALTITLLFGTGLLGNGVWASGAKPLKVRYAVLAPGLSNAHMDLALEKGFYQKNGIDLQILHFSKGGAEAMAAVASGQIDAGNFGSPILTGIAKKIPIKVIASPPIRENSFVLVARNEIKSVADLKGKTVAAGIPGNGTYQAFQKIIKAHGLTIDDFKTTNNTTSNDALLVLQSGKVAAAISNEPTATIIRLRGIGRTIAKAADYFGNYQHSYVFASDAFIKSKPAAVRNLLKTEIESRFYAQKHPEELFAFSQRKYGYEPEVIRQYFQDAFAQWNFDGAVNKEGTRNALKILEELGEAENVDQLKDEEIFDLRFLPAAKK